MTRNSVYNYSRYFCVAELEWEESCGFEMEAISTSIKYYLSGKRNDPYLNLCGVITDINKFFTFSKTEEILGGSNLYVVRRTCY